MQPRPDHPLGDSADSPLRRALDDAAQLRAENARLREMLDMAQDFGRLGLWERDPHTLEGRWDAHMFRFFGFEPGPTPTFAEAAQRVHPEDRMLGTRFAESLRQPGSHSHRYRIVRPDGSVAHLHSQWRVIADADGRPARVIGALMDDTETHLLAQREATARTQLELALPLARIGLWRYDLATRRIHYDTHAQAVLARSTGPDGLPVEQVRRWIHPDDLADVQAAMVRTIEEGGPVDTQTRYRHADGSWRMVLTRRVLQRDAHGRPQGIVGVGIDITEQHQRTMDALQLARRLDTAAEAARVGLWWGPLDGSLPEWNLHMYTLLGRDPVHGPLRLGDAIGAYVHPDDRERVAAEALPWLREPAPVSFELSVRIVRGDGALRWMEVRCAQSVEPDGQRRAYGTLLDVTESHQSMERLREAHQRVTLALSGAGMGCWSHDLNGQRDHWDEQMFRLRGMAPRNEAPGHDERMSLVVEEDRPMLKAAFDASNNSVETLAYDFRIRRVDDGALRTLASRSVAVTGEDGRVLRRIGINWDVTEARSAERAQRERELAVQASRAQAALFARISHELRTPLNAVLGFTQLLLAEDARTDAAQRARRLLQVREAGEKLLALVDGVLALSEAGAGESLSRDPVAPAAAVQRAQAAHAAASAPTLLYIEDNEVNMLIVRELLAQRPALTFRGAADGTSGLALARTLQPALVLIDMQLPDMDGLQVLRHLRAEPRTASIPCVALSANAMPDDIEHALGAGFDDYWTKPIDLSAFLAALDRLLPAR